MLTVVSIFSLVMLSVVCGRWYLSLSVCLFRGVPRLLIVNSGNVTLESCRAMTKLLIGAFSSMGTGFALGLTEAAGVGAPTDGLLTAGHGLLILSFPVLLLAAKTDDVHSRPASASGMGFSFVLTCILAHCFTIERICLLLLSQRASSYRSFCVAIDYFAATRPNDTIRRPSAAVFHTTSTCLPSISGTG